MNTNIFHHRFLLMVIPLTLLLCGTVHGDSARKPNIVLVLADDCGWGDAGCNNPEAVFPTPDIDRIAQEGLRMTDALTPHSVCTPTRYAPLTGRYCWRTHVREGVLAGYGKSLIPRRRMTIASVLKQAGYRAGAFGKWHVGLSFNQLPVILGESETPARQSMITQSYTGVLSVRFEPWKLILDTKGSGGHESATPGFQPLIQGGPWEFQAVRTGQLYDLQHDPYETTDLFEKRQDVVEELTQFLTKAVSDGRTRP